MSTTNESAETSAASERQVAECHEALARATAEACDELFLPDTGTALTTDQSRELRYAEQSKVLNELTQDAATRGLYDRSYEDYAEALDQARHQ
ncbi:MAG: hypothetical protein LBM66_06430 [Bifidobacteriaceae bacterium]|nr:hypothetical protein [Bifidobacteriaceae bacterium]